MDLWELLGHVTEERDTRQSAAGTANLFLQQLIGTWQAGMPGNFQQIRTRIYVTVSPTHKSKLNGYKETKTTMC